MISSQHVTETRPPKKPELATAKNEEQPYAIVWIHDKEIRLYENDEGQFFTA